MVKKKLMIGDQSAILLDMENASSIAFFDDILASYDGSIDTDVKRAIVYNKVVVENLIKRIFSSQMHTKTDEQIKKNQIKLRDTLYKKDEYKSYSKIYYADVENEDFQFIEEICDENKNVRSYNEYIIYSLINHYFDYIKN